MINTIFMDLDGTLLNDKKEILNENIETIRKLNEHNINLVLCSGRQISQLKKFQQILNTSNYIIAANGAEIYDININMQIFSCPIDYNSLLCLFENIDRSNLIIRLDTKYGRYVNKQTSLLKSEILYNNLDNLINNNSIYQVTLGSLDSIIIDKLVTVLDKLSNIKIENRYISKKEIGIVYMINIVNKDVSKGNAIKFLCNYLNIDLKTTMGFGDDNNDISMFKTVGYSVAMNNAINEIKQLSSKVITSNNEPRNI